MATKGGIKLNLRKFDMDMIKDDKVVVMIGKRETGKSWLVKDLLHRHRDIPIGTVISPTEGVNQFFGDIVPPVFIHDEVTPELLANVVRRQQMIVKRVRAQQQAFGSSSIDPRAFLLMDDCMYNSAAFVKDKNLRFLFMNGRHTRVLTVMTQQYPLGIPPSLRTQIDFVFILRENIAANRKRIYDSYAGMFPTFDIFCQVMDQCTENFECIVIANNAQSNKLTDQVFWYRAPQHPDFKIGLPAFWSLSKDASDDADDDEDDEDGDQGGDGLLDIGRKRNAPVVMVSKGARPGAARQTGRLTQR
jgi:hypothetical protein